MDEFSESKLDVVSGFRNVFREPIKEKEAAFRRLHDFVKEFSTDYDSPVTT